MTTAKTSANGTDWTPEELDRLRTLRADGVPGHEIARQLGRTPGAVYARCRIAGVLVMQRRSWDEEETARLLALYRENAPIAAIAEALGRKANSVRWKLDDLGVGGARVRYWNGREDARLGEIAAAALERTGTVDPVEVAAELARGTNAEPRSATAVEERLRHLALMPAVQRRWSADEVARLRAGYAEGVSPDALAAALDRTAVAVAAKAFALGLTADDRRWTAEEDARLARMLAENLDMATIAARLGRRERGVSVHALKAGLRQPSRRRAPLDAQARERIVAAALAGEGISIAAKRLGFDQRRLKQVATEEGVSFAGRGRSDAAKGAVKSAVSRTASGRLPGGRRSEMDTVAIAKAAARVEAGERRAREREEKARIREEREAKVRLADEVRAKALEKIRLARASGAASVDRGAVVAVAKREEESAERVFSGPVADAVGSPRSSPRRPAKSAVPQREMAVRLRTDTADAVAAFLASRGVTRESVDPLDGVVRALRRRGYAVVGDGDGGWLVDGRHRLPDAAALVAFGRERNVDLGLAQAAE